jgi:flavin-dependent dehydrogenase
MARGGIWDVAVAGAGPAGSATAALLAARGFKVLLLDRAAFPRPKPCAEYLGPGAVAILERLGLELKRAGTWAPIAGMRIVAADQTAFEGRFRWPEGGIGIRREILDTGLLELAARRGACVLERVTATDLSFEDRAVVLKGRTDKHRALTFKTRLLIGADGLHSRIARSLGLGGRSRVRRIALVTHTPGPSLADDLAEIHLAPCGYLGLAPVGEGWVNVAIVTDATRPAGLSLEKWFRTLLDQYPELEERLRQEPFVDPPRAAGPFRVRCRSPVGHRAVLVGDAAEFYEPLTGDGIYAALRGAELIDRHVAPNLERDTLAVRQLSAYRRARDRAFRCKRILERLMVGAASRAWFPALAALFQRHRIAADVLVQLTGHANLAPYGTHSPDRPAGGRVAGKERAGWGMLSGEGS